MLTRLVPSLALVAGLVACSPGYSAEPGFSATVGQVFPALLGDDLVGDVTTVRLPGRVYEVEVSRPQDSVDVVSADEAGVAPGAAPDRAFVAVAWHSLPASGDAIALGYGGPDVSPEITLLAGDGSYPIGPMDEEGVYASWVAVPAGAGPIGVAVGFDGVTRTVADVTDPRAVPVGGSALLDADPQPGLHTPDCPEPAEDPEPARYGFGSCHVQVSDPFPYHRDLGWAPEGRAWVVVRLSVEPVVVGWDEPGPGGAVVSYEVAPEDVEVTVDGAGPTDVVAREQGDRAGLQDDGRWVGDAVFAVPADVDGYEVAFARPYTGLPEDPAEAAAEGTPAELTGTYAATFPIGG